MRQIEYPRLNKMLNCGCPFKKEMKAKTQQCIYDVAIKELYGAPESSFSDAQLRNSICVGMEGFLKSFRTRAIFKQELKSKLIAWIDAIEKTYGLSSNNSVEMWPDFVEKDVGIELVKLLHARYPGITKNDLSKSLGVSKKTIQNYLRKLDPSLNESEQQTDSSPLRIGGHEMHVDIESEEVQLRGDRAYYTPNTLHPVVMQFNVTQVAATLMALQNAYDRVEYDSYCAEVAFDIWCQLSDYCKERIRLIFTENNPEFSAFVKMLDEDMDEGRYPVFKTEHLMAEDATKAEQIAYAYKASHVCNLTLRINGVTRTYQKIRILKNNADYICYSNDPETGEESRIPFTVGNVRHIDLL